MSEYKQKIQEFMISDIEGKKNLTILEFGVREGTSTKLFLNHCEKKVERRKYINKINLKIIIISLN